MKTGFRDPIDDALIKKTAETLEASFRAHCCELLRALHHQIGNITHENHH